MWQVWQRKLGSQVQALYLHFYYGSSSSRSTCNVCNGPQFCVEEERTGLGGGFNERGTVEYKEREESDDEFDDLGRKKKKFKGQMIRKPMESLVPDFPAHSDEEEEEEEEEDDDDDGDLSKYDLWGDDDGKDDKKDEKNGNKEEVKKDDAKRKKSRSRSRSRGDRRSRSKDTKKARSRRSRSSRFTKLFHHATNANLVAPKLFE